MKSKDGKPKPSIYFDRELSWLAFNERVLQEAADRSVPLLERLKFLAIYSSNLDEFFRVRVAALRSLLRLKEKKLDRLSFSPARRLQLIHRTVLAQQRWLGKIFETELLPALKKEGIVLHTENGIPNEFLGALREYFRHEVAPLVRAEVVSAKSKPFLHNKGLYLAVELWPGEEQDVRQLLPRYGIVNIPSDRLPRFLPLDNDSGVRHVVFLDDVVRLGLPELFAEYEVGEAYAVKMTRDAELYIEDEFSGDLVELIQRSLKKRETGLPTRLLYDLRMPYPMLTAIKATFDLADEDLALGGYYHNFSDFFSFPDFGRTDLKYEPMPPAPVVGLAPGRPLLEQVSERDFLLSFPYQSFNPVIRFLEETAADEAVTDIWITLYRVASDSQIVGALINAARSGKSVTAFVEVKARFDEQPNIDWARRMVDAGVKVLYSMPGLKVHAKAALIARNEAGKSVHYAYLSTGNFNEKTAQVYADHGLFTADSRITKDVRTLFAFLEQSETKPKFTTLLVAPFNMRRKFLALVERETKHANEGRRANVFLKMNALEDNKMVRRLHKAAKAGVDTEMVVRGICTLCVDDEDPDGRIRVTSIVDRFLEHARIFAFNNDGNPEVYLASADWMTRNLNRRIEIAFPILDGRIRSELFGLLECQRADNRKARIINAEQTNPYRAGPGRPRQAQQEIYTRLKGEA